MVSQTSHSNQPKPSRFITQRLPLLPGTQIQKVPRNNSERYKIPVELLRRLHCDWESTSRPWIVHLVLGVCGNDPIQHLLLIRFLGYSAREFFNRAPELPNPRRAAFGTGPWPCLNGACKDYQIESITDISLKESARKKTTVGMIKCPNCGFTYLLADTKAGPTKYHVIEYGPVFDAALKRMWADPSLSVTEILRRLNVSFSAVDDGAKRLKCPRPRPGLQRPADDGPSFDAALRRMWYDPSLSQDQMCSTLRVGLKKLQERAIELGLCAPGKCLRYRVPSTTGSPKWNEFFRRLWDNPTLKIHQIVQILNLSPVEIKKHAHQLGCRYPRRLVPRIPKTAPQGAKDTLLKQMWDDPELTRRQIARILGASLQNVNRRARELGLMFPRSVTLFRTKPLR